MCTSSSEPSGEAAGVSISLTAWELCSSPQYLDFITLQVKFTASQVVLRPAWVLQLDPQAGNILCEYGVGREGSPFPKSIHYFLVSANIEGGKYRAYVLRIRFLWGFF